ncbi:MAG: hypothetical protein ACLFTT_14215 [Candidatus Hydrogenedentota bacterium]
MAQHKDLGVNRREFLQRAGWGAAFAGGAVTMGSTWPGVAMAQAAAGGPAFLAGWAVESITPDKPVQLAGQFAERVSRQVLDPCLATALALERTGDNGEKEQAILVSCDLVNVNRESVEAIRESVAQRLPDFDARKLIINTSHTHTGPTLRPGIYREPDEGVMGPREYAPFFRARAEEAAVRAWSDRQPGAVSHALGRAAVGFNRIAVYADGTAKMYGNSNQPDFRGLEGGCDHGVELLYLWDAEGGLTGIVINVACPSQVVEGQLYVSADFWGALRKLVAERYGEGVHVYPMTGAAGDQSPRDLVRRGRGEPDMRKEEGMNEMARRIMHAIGETIEQARSEQDAAPLFMHRVEEITLPVRRATEQEAAEARAEVDRLTAEGSPKPGSRDQAMLRRAKGVVDRFAQQDETPGYAMDLHAIRLADVAIVTNPFELYLEYGEQIKARSKAKQTLIAQLSGDRGGYLPTVRAVAGGAYGSRITENRVGPEGGDMLVEHSVTAINTHWE